MTFPIPSVASNLEQTIALAFNRGSDARLAGLSRTANPYPSDRRLEARYWRKGWEDVATHWGKQAPGSATPLIPLREAL